MPSYTFDGVSKIIQFDTTSSTEVVDIYSRWKEWVIESDNAKYLQAFRTVGGDPITDTKSLGITYFLTNGWKIRPFSANHTVDIEGNLYAEEVSGSQIVTVDPVIPATGSAQVIVRLNVSNLVDAEVLASNLEQSLEYGGIIYYDSKFGTAGTTYPIGTAGSPVNNLVDAVTLANSFGFHIINLNTDGVINSDVNEISFRGITRDIDLEFTGTNVNNCEFKNVAISGSLSGSIHIIDSVIEEVDNLSGEVGRCSLVGPISINPTENVIFHDCFSNVPGNDSPIINCSGSIGFNMAAHSGGIRYTNINNPSFLNTTEFIAGRLNVDSTCTTGFISARGVAKVNDESSGSVTIDRGSLINNDINQQILLLEYNECITYNSSIGVSGSEYPVGTFGKPVNNIEQAVALAKLYNFNNIALNSNATLTVDAEGLAFIGSKSNITLTLTGTNIGNGEFRNLNVNGIMSGSANFFESFLGEINNFAGGAKDSALIGPIKLSNFPSIFYSNTSYQPNNSPVVFDVSESSAFSIRGHTGGLLYSSSVDNFFSNTTEFVAGDLTLDSTITNASISVKGVATLINSSSATIETDSLINNSLNESAQLLEYNNQVVYDISTVNSGTEYPVGTASSPVNNLNDAVTIAKNKGFNKVLLLTSGSLNTADATNILFEGNTLSIDNKLIISGSNLDRSQFRNVYISGSELQGFVMMNECLLGGGTTGFLGGAIDCGIIGDITVNGSDPLRAPLFQNCFKATTDYAPLKINLNGGFGFNNKNFSGDLIYENSTNPSFLGSLEFNTGKLFISSSNTNGTLVVRGIGEVEDSGSILVVTSSLMSRDLDVTATTDLGNIPSQVDEIYTLHGLKSGSQLTVTETLRTAGAISQSIDNNGNRTTVGRI